MFQIFLVHSLLTPASLPPSLYTIQTTPSSSSDCFTQLTIQPNSTENMVKCNWPCIMLQTVHSCSVSTLIFMHFMPNQEKERYSTFPCTGKLSMTWQWGTLRATLDGSENLLLLPGIQPPSLCHPACSLFTVLLMYVVSTAILPDMRGASQSYVMNCKFW
jgi:hypothetical protein